MLVMCRVALLIALASGDACPACFEEDQSVLSLVQLKKRASSVSSSGDTGSTRSELALRRKDGNSSIDYPHAQPSCKGFECFRRYMENGDDSYAWNFTGRKVHAVDKTTDISWSAHLIRMRSQQWLSANETDHPYWDHELVIVVPANLHSVSCVKDVGFLMIGSAPTAFARHFMFNFVPDAQENRDLNSVAQLATRTGLIGALLLEAPNEGIKFSADPSGKSLSEEAIKAFSYRNFYKHPDQPDLLVEMPIMKSVVRALDTMASYASQQLRTPLQRFGLLGCSKRGLATWHAGAYDPRVAFIVPGFIGLAPGRSGEMNHQNLGGIGYMETAYYAERTYAAIGTFEGHLVDQLLDPTIGGYASRFNNIPKFVPMAGNDDFFGPDASRLFYPKLPGPKSFLMLPNARHQTHMDMDNVLLDISAFIKGILLKKAAPKIAYQLDNSTGAITVHHVSDHTPRTVLMWTAYTCDSRRRDFRASNADQGEECAKCGVKMETAPHQCLNSKVNWESSPLSETRPGSRKWVAHLDAPTDGRWAAFYVEFKYDWPVQGEDTFRTTTEVSVVPDTEPFDPCRYEDCADVGLVLAQLGLHRSMHEEAIQ